MASRSGRSRAISAPRCADRGGYSVRRAGAGTPSRAPTVTREKSRLPKMLGNYETSDVSPVNNGNTTRIDSLLRDSPAPNDSDEPA